jgi:hypothetical protein
VAVHLFVRGKKKQSRGGAAPFVYCGDVAFVAWRGEAPITVTWRLPEPVPDGIARALGAGDAPA